MIIHPASEEVSGRRERSRERTLQRTVRARLRGRRLRLLKALSAHLIFGACDANERLPLAPLPMVLPVSTWAKAGACRNSHQ